VSGDTPIQTTDAEPLLSFAELDRRDHIIAAAAAA
jgi:hypothetical protein